MFRGFLARRQAAGLWQKVRKIYVLACVYLIPTFNVGPQFYSSGKGTPFGAGDFSRTGTAGATPAYTSCARCTLKHCISCQSRQNNGSIGDCNEQARRLHRRIAGRIRQIAEYEPPRIPRLRTRDRNRYVHLLASSTVYSVAFKVNSHTSFADPATLFPGGDDWLAIFNKVRDEPC